MTRTSLLALFTAIISFSACNQQSQTDESTENELKLLQISQRPNNLKSIFLSITDKQEADTAFLYSVKGVFNSDTVGFIVSLDKDVEPGVTVDGLVDEVAGFKVGTIKFIGTGTESDRFVAALAQLWGIPDSIYQFSDTPVAPLTFSSNNQEVNQRSPSTSNFKLFFDQDSEEPGEVFFTLDTYLRTIEIQEKDDKFRMAIFQSLIETPNTDVPVIE